MSRVGVALLVGCMGVPGIGARAQGGPEMQTAAVSPGAQVPTITVQSQLVLVPTEVRTKRGDNIYGLHAEDFAITADGVPQRVRLDDSGDPVPLSLVVLVQCSRTAFREGPKIHGLATMVDAIVGGAPAQVAVADFGTEPELLTTLTADPDRRDRALSGLQPCYDDGGNSIYDAIDYADQLLQRHHAPGRRVILLVSETRDHGSLTKPAKVLEALDRTNTVLDAVAFSPARDEMAEDLKTSDGASGGLMGLLLTAVQALRKNAPKEFSRQSGGEYINFSSEKGFDRDLNSLANRIHNDYALSFVPHFPPGSAGNAPGLHTVTVKVEKYPDAVLQHREAYWTAAPALP